MDMLVERFPKHRDGRMDQDAIRMAFQPEHYPLHREGKLTTAEALQEFLDTFDNVVNGTAKMTRTGLLDYCRCMAFALDSEEAFRMFVFGCFGLVSGENLVMAREGEIRENPIKAPEGEKRHFDDSMDVPSSSPALIGVHTSNMPMVRSRTGSSLNMVVPPNAQACMEQLLTRIRSFLIQKYSMVQTSISGRAYRQVTLNTWMSEFRRRDVDCTGMISLEDFGAVLLGPRRSLSQAPSSEGLYYALGGDGKLEWMFQQLDPLLKHKIPYETWKELVRGRVSAERTESITKAWLSVDEERRGYILVPQLEKMYQKEGYVRHE